MDRIEAMRAFLAVAQEGSFTGGARRLGLSTKLVSKRVAALEARLGAQLFARTTRSVSLTDAGQTYRDRAGGLIDQFDELDATLRARQDTLAGQIRITAPTGFGSHPLPDALAPFIERNRQVEVQLFLSNARLDLAAEGYDLAIRVGAPADSSMIVRRLAPMPFVICAAPDYLARAGAPRRPSDLSHHECLIDESLAEPRIWRFRPVNDRSARNDRGGSRPKREVAVRVAGRLRANAPAALAGLALAGAGVARSPAYAVADAIHEGRLTSLLTDYASADAALCALYPPNRHLPTRVRALIDHLADHFSAAPWVTPDPVL
ncbi:MAG: LysR family transcriptional regulator [Alphaproteobacteria bacterium]|nr:LysR family transcriptional regulator [Alphaproteobacteria bacterium]